MQQLSPRLKIIAVPPRFLTNKADIAVDNEEFPRVGSRVQKDKRTLAVFAVQGTALLVDVVQRCLDCVQVRDGAPFEPQVLVALPHVYSAVQLAKALFPRVSPFAVRDVLEFELAGLRVEQWQVVLV